MNIRNKYLDIIKYIAIFMVIWGHVVQQTYLWGKLGEVNPYLDEIYRVIYTIHMPLFMGICGYFFSKSIKTFNNTDKVNYLIKRIKSLIIPMVSIGTIHFCINIFAKGSSYISLLQYIKDIKNVWFIGDLIVNIILVSVFIFIVKKYKYNKILIGGGTLIFTLMPYKAQGLYMYIFFVLGIFLERYLEKEKMIKLRSCSFLFVAIILYYILYSIYSTYNHYSFEINIFKYEFLPLVTVNFFKLILGIIGSYIILVIVYYIKNVKLLQKMAIQGQYTLEIYLLNIIILEQLGGTFFYPWICENVEYNILQDNGLFFEIVSTFFISIIVIGLLKIMIDIIYKNKVLSKILFYKVKK